MAATVSDLIGRRGVGHVRVSIVNTRAGEEMPALLDRLGIHAEGGTKCRELDVTSARQLLINLFTKDLAYSGEAMPRDYADVLADLVLKNVFPSSARLLTNLDASPDAVPSGNYGLLWATPATFGVGIIALGDAAAACVWVEDED